MNLKNYFRPEYLWKPLARDRHRQRQRGNGVVPVEVGLYPFGFPRVGESMSVAIDWLKSWPKRVIQRVSSDKSKNSMTRVALNSGAHLDHDLPCKSEDLNNNSTEESHSMADDLDANEDTDATDTSDCGRGYEVAEGEGEGEWVDQDSTLFSPSRLSVTCYRDEMQCSSTSVASNARAHSLLTRPSSPNHASAPSYCGSAPPPVVEENQCGGSGSGSGKDTPRTRASWDEYQRMQLGETAFQRIIRSMANTDIQLANAT